MSKQASSPLVNNPEWLSIPQLARRIGVSAESLYRRARNGELPGCAHVGRRFTVNYDRFEVLMVGE